MKNRQKDILLKIVLLHLTVMTYIAVHGQNATDSLDFDRKQNFDFNWKFTKGDFPEAIHFGFDDSSWQELDLPHDWSIDGNFQEDNPSGAAGAFAEGGIGWYRKRFQLPAGSEGKKVAILFGGVYMNSEVWINGNYLGKRPYGYISFQYDLSPYLNFDKENIVAVRVDDSKQPSARWYTGAGIYRHVWLIQTNPLHVSEHGVFFTTPEVSHEKAELRIATQLENTYPENRNTVLITELLDCENRTVASVTTRGDIASGGKRDFQQQVMLKNPNLWTPDNPYLYTLRTSVKSENQLLDELYTKVGIRSIRFETDSGFFLNDQNIKIKGVNNHSDLGALGAAVNKQVIERRLKLLKEMGCNAIRTAHNPPCEELLNLCDSMGLMVMDEAFDEWIESWPWENVKHQGKAKYGYHLFFEEWAERDLVSLIRRDRNHPSIILWSVGNEIPDQCYEIGTQRLKRLMEVVRREDTTRLVTCGITHMHLANKSGFAQQLDVTGYNGGGGSCFMYEEDHSRYPSRKFIATEVPHTFQTRGIYRTQSWYRSPDPEGGIMEVPNLTAEELFNGVSPFYSSSYDNAMVRISARDSWKRTRDLPFMAGEFRWTGFDYLGESLKGWPAKLWNYGIIDMCGFEKDTYYFYQSQWTQKPMVHLLPHWTWPGKEGIAIPVVVYSNCDMVELFLNGRSLGEKKMKDETDLVWNVPYQPGELKAVGRNDGKELALFEVKTAGNPAKIRLVSDRKIFRPNRTDIAHIEVEICDELDIFTPEASNKIIFQVQGGAEIMGIDNGDPLNTGSYKGNVVNAFKGKCLLIVKSNENREDVKITASSPGLESGKIWIKK